MPQLSDSSDSSAVAGRTLAAELKKKVRERGLVIWVDAEKQYSDFVKSLGQGSFDFGYPVVGQFLGFEVCQKMKAILTSDDDLPFLDQAACRRSRSGVAIWGSSFVGSRMLVNSTAQR